MTTKEENTLYYGIKEYGTVVESHDLYDLTGKNDEFIVGFAAVKLSHEPDGAVGWILIDKTEIGDIEIGTRIARPKSWFTGAKITIVEGRTNLSGEELTWEDGKIVHRIRRCEVCGGDMDDCPATCQDE